MKKSVLLLGLAVLIAAGAVAPNTWAETITSEERTRLVKHLRETRKAFVDATTGLTDAQWTFKPSAERWSIAECAEHIALSEDGLYDLVTKKTLKGPVSPVNLAEARERDEVILKRVVDRSQTAQAPEFLRPSGRFPTRAALLEHFNQSRDRTIAFVESTQEDLRAHSTPHPIFKAMDAYHWLLLISAHSSRHTAQINEVKTATGYPR